VQGDERRVEHVQQVELEQRLLRRARSRPELAPGVVYSKQADGTALFKAERSAVGGPFEAYFESTLRV
jgi:hypothetical protein